ncbi:MAG TPA: LptA/OstA family protein [Desulfatiglandales bacterium]|nr:LptA/OstA family protein [Desulfatiglandales bacterium]
MKASTFFYSISFVIFFVILAPVRMNSFAQEQKVLNKTTSEKPIVIYSDTLELDQGKRVIVFSGAVQAKSEDMEVECHKMILYYLENPAENQSNVNSARIDKIIALGDVNIKRSVGGKAGAGKAVFYQNEQKVVLSENPFIQQGPDFVEGDRIIIFLKENRSIIEGSETKRVRATIFPKEEKGE